MEISHKGRTNATRHLIVVDRALSDVLLARDVWYLPPFCSRAGPVLMHETTVTSTVGQVIFENVFSSGAPSSAAKEIVTCAKNFFKPNSLPNCGFRDHVHFIFGYDEALQVQQGKTLPDPLLARLQIFLTQLEPILQSNVVIVWSSLLQFNYVPSHADLSARIMALIHKKVRNLIIRDYTYDIPAVRHGQRNKWSPRYKCEVGKRILDAIAADISPRVSFISRIANPEDRHPIDRFVTDESCKITEIQRNVILDDGTLVPTHSTPIENFVTSPYIPSWLIRPHPYDTVVQAITAPPMHTYSDVQEPLDLSLSRPISPPSAASPVSQLYSNLLFNQEQESAADVTNQSIPNANQPNSIPSPVCFDWVPLHASSPLIDLGLDPCLEQIDLM